MRLRKHLKHFVSLLLIGLTIPSWGRNWNAKMDWQATGDGKTDDSPAIQRGVTAMRSGDTVVFPAPGSYFVATTVNFQALGIGVKCEPDAALVGPDKGTDIFVNLQSNTAIGGSATTGCTFRGGGIQAYGGGGDGGQTLDQTVFNLTFTDNTFENMTYGPDNFRSNRGILIGGGSNHVLIRHNTFSNIMPCDNGFNAAGKTYLEQYDPDGDSAIWFYESSNYTIDLNTFSAQLSGHQSLRGTTISGSEHTDSSQLLRFPPSDVHGDQTETGCGNSTYNAGTDNFQVYDNYGLNASPLSGGKIPSAYPHLLHKPNNQEVASIHPSP
jgi:polygalacturonase